MENITREFCYMTNSSAEAVPPLSHLPEQIFMRHCCSASFTSLLQVADVTRRAQGNVSLTNKSYLCAGWLQQKAGGPALLAKRFVVCPNSCPTSVASSTSVTLTLAASNAPACSAGLTTGCGTNRRPLKMKGMRVVYSHWNLVFICLCFTAFYATIKATVWATLLWLSHGIFQELSVSTADIENPKKL